ncbi:hypothetical protein [Chondrinema litorale]|uniref:hypothetical protein n=1 Tax=Chondrinema litorale TaxID=2994555 RepID=UPI002543A74A|nr:hypothetical protein [Chondrinema litorale]UZS00223.1 hypothetical protein OQ292_40395 [Chondrinema litorale]
MSNSKEMFTLEIVARDAVAEWSKVSIIDAQDHLRKSGTGSFSVQLPKGLYTVLVEYDKDTTQDIIRHTRNNIFYISTPKNLNQAETSEYFNIVPSSDFNKYDTIALQQSQNKIKRNVISIEEDSSTGSLFIFLRFEERWNRVYKQIQLSNFYFEKLKLRQTDWDIDKSNLWQSFKTDLPEGFYFVSFNEDEGRSYPIQIFKDKQTQITLNIKNKPLLHTFKIEVSKSHRYEPLTEGSESYVLALQKLQFFDYRVSSKMVDDLAYGKWEHPMYGIVIAYLCLLWNSDIDNSLINKVVENLNERILPYSDSPDLRILNLLTKKQQKNSSEFQQILSEESSFIQLPMFRIGFETLISLSYKAPHLIPSESLPDLIANRVYFDTPWLCFKPIKNKFLPDTQFPKHRKGRTLLEKVTNTISKIDELKDWGEEVVPIVAYMLERKGIEKVSVQQLAMELRIPTTTLLRKVNELTVILFKNPKTAMIAKDILNQLLDTSFNIEKAQIIIERFQKER